MTALKIYRRVSAYGRSAPARIYAAENRQVYLPGGSLFLKFEGFERWKLVSGLQLHKSNVLTLVGRGLPTSLKPLNFLVLVEF
jgi:hypothetical protein